MSPAPSPSVRAAPLALALLTTHIGIMNITANEIRLLEEALDEMRENQKATLLLAYMVEIVKRIHADWPRLREECTREMEVMS